MQRLFRDAPAHRASSAATPAIGRLEPRFEESVTLAPELDDEIDAESPAPSRKPRSAARASRRSAGGYILPPIELLAAPKSVARTVLSADALEANATALEGVLSDFGVRGEIINARPGPVVTLYELEPAPGIKSSRVIGLADDIARSMP